MQPIIDTSPLELLHIGFMSLEVTMKLDQPLNVVSILVFCDHFMKHVKAYMTPYKAAKTIAWFLWQGHISIFGAQAKVLSNQVANFESNIIKEFCELRQVEWAHQMLMHMIGKLSKDQKGRLAQAFTGVGTCLQLYKVGHHWVQPALLMLRCQTHLHVDFYFPMIWGIENLWHDSNYIAGLYEQLQEVFKEAQEESTAEAKRQKQYYDRKANTILLETGDLVLAKANAYKGKRKVKDW